DPVVRAAPPRPVLVLVAIPSTHKSFIAKPATHKAFTLYSGDDLLAGARSPYPGVIGVKPGFTGDAGYCQAFAANRHGHMIVGVVLGEPDWNVRLDDMRKLLDWGFSEENIPPAPPPTPYAYPTLEAEPSPEAESPARSALPLTREVEHTGDAGAKRLFAARQRKPRIACRRRAERHPRRDGDGAPGDQRLGEG